MVNIPKWKFEALRSAILKAAETEISFSRLKDAVSALLSAEQRAELGSLGWHVTTVKLELEVRGEIKRIAGVKPLRIKTVEA